MPERKKLLLRLDPAVYEAVAKWAADDLRSVNAQIEYGLRLALKHAGREPKRSAEGDGGGERGRAGGGRRGPASDD
ncbi:hypothetical protein [Thermostaphylospora chromogena]|jgi:hypothetical protein|uniref:Arc-like DNA binding domain-containing protein n=1 Tax=Thermostaphylospora chromogena TaxID=35622 RepID=A0A1H1D8V6_9ACTN|nr:hypothetical protein [Thermostaphylospora chromogena]SDQ72840.1 hypothetical protein SAMN04489764_1878 [Thermostaphylospora chromogena]